MEACALRLQDVDFTCHPTKIHVRREYSKTRRARDIYILDEATNHLQKLLEFRKNDLEPETLVFSIKKNAKAPKTIYDKIVSQFQQLQRIAHKDARKENSKRRRITLHSFRRTTFSIVNDQVGSEYANFYLGHNHSPYWTHKETERRTIYLQKCMHYLTVLDYTALDRQQKNIQNELAYKDKQISELMQFKHEITTLLKEPKKFAEMLQENKN